MRRLRRWDRGEWALRISGFVEIVGEGEWVVTSREMLKR